MNQQYKIDQEVLKNIVQDKITYRDLNSKVILNSYSKNKKESHHLWKNNVNACNEMLEMSNVVYRIKCPMENCIK